MQEKLGNSYVKYQEKISKEYMKNWMYIYMNVEKASMMINVELL